MTIKTVQVFIVHLDLRQMSRGKLQEQGRLQKDLISKYIIRKMHKNSNNQTMDFQIQIIQSMSNMIISISNKKTKSEKKKQRVQVQ